MIESLNNVASKSAAQTKGLLVICETSYDTLTNYLNVLSVDIAILFNFFPRTHINCVVRQRKSWILGEMKPLAVQLYRKEICMDRFISLPTVFTTTKDRHVLP